MKCPGAHWQYALVGAGVKFPTLELVTSVKISITTAPDVYPNETVIKLNFVLF